MIYSFLLLSLNLVIFSASYVKIKKSKLKGLRSLLNLKN
jgi:hypothetical protein